MDALLLSVTKRAEAIHTAIKEIHYLQAERQVKDILTIRNGLNTIPMLSLPILLKVYVWHKKDSWNKLYKLLAINSRIYIINIPYKLTNFQSTVIKPYYIKEEIPNVLK
jgi:hypothetical protein